MSTVITASVVNMAPQTVSQTHFNVTAQH